MITTKAALIEAMKADHRIRLHGHTGARPSSPWKYRLLAADGKTEIDTVSSTVANRMHAGNLLIAVRSSWSFGVYRMSRAALAA